VAGTKPAKTIIQPSLPDRRTRTSKKKKMKKVFALSPLFLSQLLLLFLCRPLFKA